MSIQPQQTHGVPGQINVCVLDVDSGITSHGKHNRLLVFMDRQSGQIEIREDDIGLPWSTEKDRRRVACRTYQRMHPKNTRLNYQKSEQSPNGKNVWHFYEIDNGRRAVA